MSSPRSRRISQLLATMTRLFRAELYRRLTEEEGMSELRPAHLPLFASIRPEGSRLTELAEWTTMTRSSTAELVDDLERKGFVRRVPDPRDGRAKLIQMTPQGRAALEPAARIVAALELEYAGLIGAERYDDLRGALDELVDALQNQGRSRPTGAKPSTTR